MTDLDDHLIFEGYINKRSVLCNEFVPAILRTGAKSVLGGGAKGSAQAAAKGAAAKVAAPSAVRAASSRAYNFGARQLAKPGVQRFARGAGYVGLGVGGLKVFGPGLSSTLGQSLADFLEPIADIAQKAGVTVLTLGLAYAAFKGAKALSRYMAGGRDKEKIDKEVRDKDSNPDDEIGIIE